MVCGAAGDEERVVPGVSGLVAAPGDGGTFLARVEALLDDPAARRPMGRAARESAETRSLDAAVAQMTEPHARVARAAPDPAYAG